MDARDWTREVMARPRLTLNETKTKLRNARRESFDFPGYTLGLQRHWEDGRRYLGTCPCHVLELSGWWMVRAAGGLAGNLYTLAAQ